ncbi:acyltransferase [Streptomyces sp. S.PB5]|uniref:acyltransferase family protein n=1 Tax=Streptomyces sp. S.PB5 TaxID=3020844 RepID=UPI0025B0D1D6|nr:acyltransferase [Streptomyces sp. S.PB5]MDN3026748.1 acyltransferase [Streptomyces sp. S.PB5]
MGRDRYVDFLRAWAILLVVLGHWLITALVWEPGGGIRAPELLAEVPWTQWLTLGFQIMPLFFFAGGYAAGGSWAAARGAGSGWVRRRVLRLLVPAGVYSGLVLLAVAVCQGVGVEPGTLELVGWAMGMQFWFLPVYVVLSAVTPVLYAAHRRWGLLVPVGMGVVAGVAAYTPHLGMLDHLLYLLVWGIAYQLGFCWRDGLLQGKGLGLAVCGGLGFAGLVGFGPFPVSLIRVTGQEPSNTDPPSLAMLAWVVAQVGVCLLVAPVVRRLLVRERVWRVVRGVGGASMTLYLWHMVPVLVVAAAFYLTGIAPQPSLGSLGWWGLRVPWLVVLGAVMVGVLVGVRPLALLEGPGRARLPVWVLWVGLGSSVVSLARFAVYGFAPDGRFPVLPALGLAVGVGLVSLGGRVGVCDRELSHRSSADESSNSPLADAS